MKEVDMGEMELPLMVAPRRREEEEKCGCGQRAGTQGGGAAR